MTAQRKYDLIFCLLVAVSATSYALYLVFDVRWFMMIGNLLAGGAVGMRVCEWAIFRAVARGADADQVREEVRKLGFVLNLIVLGFLLLAGLMVAVRG